MIRIILLSIALTIASTLPVAAHIRCWPIDVLIPYLQREHGQAPSFHGIGQGGFPIQIWLSKDGKTWSFVTYRKPDQGCLMASGWNMKPLEWTTKPKKDKGA